MIVGDCNTEFCTWNWLMVTMPTANKGIRFIKADRDDG
jgi:hypothetical protein